MTPSKVPREPVVLTKDDCIAYDLLLAESLLPTHPVRRLLQAVRDDRATVIKTPDPKLVKRLQEEWALRDMMDNPIAPLLRDLLALITGKPLPPDSLTVGGASLQHDAASRASFSTSSRSLKEKT